MSALPKHEELVSSADYLAGERHSPIKHEYLSGLVYAMVGEQNTHNDTVMGALTALGSRLRGKKCRPFYSDTKVRIRLPNQLRFYYPDVQVVCDPNPASDTFQDRPVVVIEVISESTRRVDEGEKLDAYLTIPSLEAYLLVDGGEACVTVYSRTDSGFHRMVHRGLTSAIRLDCIDVDLPLAEIYERVNWPELQVIKEEAAAYTGLA